MKFRRGPTSKRFSTPWTPTTPVKWTTWSFAPSWGSSISGTPWSWHPWPGPPALIRLEELSFLLDLGRTGWAPMDPMDPMGPSQRCECWFINHDITTINYTYIILYLPFLSHLYGNWTLSWGPHPVYCIHSVFRIDEDFVVILYFG